MEIETLKILSFEDLTKKELEKVQDGIAPASKEKTLDIIFHIMENRGIGPKTPSLQIPKDFRWQIRTIGENNTANQQLVGKFKFKTYQESAHFAFAIFIKGKLSFYYPDVTFGDGYVFVYLSTLKIRGLHSNDFLMMARIDSLLNLPPSKPSNDLV